ncbi:MAG TPA: polysaccharide biosynthesis C-terminal domain-containing protein, partial [Anaerolineae bacterium]
FIIGLVFNVVANLIFIPLFSYQAAAVITIFSEIVEGSAFYFYVRQHIVKVPWLDVLGRPGLAATLMGAVIYLSTSYGFLIPGLVLGSAVYVIGIFVLRVLSPVDRMLLAPLVPARFRNNMIEPGNV